MPPEADPPIDPFVCPRCGKTVQERFWGPCRSCRSALVEANRSDPAQSGDTETARFEPTMHVVPNHVATKD